MSINGSLRGLALVSAANLAFCGMACCIRFASDINAYATTLFRFIIGIGIIGMLAMSGRMRLHFVDKKGLFARGFLGSISVYIGFISIVKLGIIKASIILYTFPVFATIFGAIILKERIRPSRCISIAVALAGMVILVAGGKAACSPGTIDSWYTLLAFAGSAIGGLTVVLIKKLQETDSTQSIFFAQCLVGFWVIFLPASSASLHCGVAGAALLVAIGLLATAGQLFSTEGLRHFSASSGSILSLSVPVLNVCAGVLLFHESFSLKSVVGGALVLGASALALRGKEKTRFINIVREKSK
jgi:drug/metabolite transporter (DMT)-like permease